MNTTSPSTPVNGQAATIYAALELSSDVLNEVEVLQ